MTDSDWHLTVIGKTFSGHTLTNLKSHITTTHTHTQTSRQLCHKRMFYLTEELSGCIYMDSLGDLSLLNDN